MATPLPLAEWIKLWAAGHEIEFRFVPLGITSVPEWLDVTTRFCWDQVLSNRTNEFGEYQFRWKPRPVTELDALNAVSDISFVIGGWLEADKDQNLRRIMESIEKLRLFLKQREKQPD